MYRAAAMLPVRSVLLHASIGAALVHDAILRAGGGAASAAYGESGAYRRAQKAKLTCKLHFFLSHIARIVRNTLREGLSSLSVL